MGAYVRENDAKSTLHGALLVEKKLVNCRLSFSDSSIEAKFCDSSKNFHVYLLISSPATRPSILFGWKYPFVNCQWSNRLYGAPRDPSMFFSAKS